MYVPPQIKNRIALLSARLDCDVEIVRCWQSDGGRPVMYCNFRALIKNSPACRLEYAGTLCCELTLGVEDLLDLFIFLNGQRLTRAVNGSDYLIGHGNAQIKWDYDDDGYWSFIELTDSTFAKPIHPDLQIPPDSDI